VRLCGERLRAAQLCAVAVLAAVWLWSSPAFSQAVSPIEYDTTALADARLGVAVATMSELADAPELLARPSSQAFVDDTFAQIALTPDTLLRTRAERRRDALRVDSVATFDRSAAYAAMGDLTKNALLAFGAKRGAFLSLGIVAEQTAYNARVLHDAEADTQDRSTIGKDAVADSVVPGLKELRADLAAPAGHSWESTADVAQLRCSDPIPPCRFQNRLRCGSWCSACGPRVRMHGGMRPIISSTSFTTTAVIKRSGRIPMEDSPTVTIRTGSRVRSIANRTARFFERCR